MTRCNLCGRKLKEDEKDGHLEGTKYGKSWLCYSCYEGEVVGLECER
jgi:hypothetical protein